MKKAALIICIISAFAIVASLIVPLIAVISADGPSVGIIGGADAPTYLLLSTVLMPFRAFIWLACLGIVGLAVSAILWIKSKKHS